MVFAMRIWSDWSGLGPGGKGRYRMSRSSSDVKWSISSSDNVGNLSNRNECANENISLVLFVRWLAIDEYAVIIRVAPFSMLACAPKSFNALVVLGITPPASLTESSSKPRLANPSTSAICRTSAGETPSTSSISEGSPSSEPLYRHSHLLCCLNVVLFTLPANRVGESSATDLHEGVVGLLTVGTLVCSRVIPWHISLFKDERSTLPSLNPSRKLDPGSSPVSSPQASANSSAKFPITSSSLEA